MKATGIIRRIDDLGRIVIPKEIRNTMHIRESDPLEIFTERDGDIILKKYSPIGELGNSAQLGRRCPTAGRRRFSWPRRCRCLSYHPSRLGLARGTC